MSSFIVKRVVGGGCLCSSNDWTFRMKFMCIAITAHGLQWLHRRGKNNPLGRLNEEKLHFWCAAAGTSNNIGSSKKCRMVIKNSKCIKSHPPPPSFRPDRDEQNFVAAFGHAPWICVCVSKRKGEKNWINVRARNQVEKAANFCILNFFYSILQQQLDASVMQTIFFCDMQYFLYTDDANLRLIYNLWCYARSLASDGNHYYYYLLRLIWVGY